MSADNGIYIGKFPKGKSFEYRVIEAQAIDNLTYFPANSDLREYFKGENPREIYEYFKDSPVFETREAADALAYEIEQNILSDDFCPILEYGICHMTFKQPFEFYKEHAKEIVYRWDINNNHT